MVLLPWQPNVAYWCQSRELLEQDPSLKEIFSLEDKSHVIIEVGHMTW